MVGLDNNLIPSKYSSSKRALPHCCRRRKADLHLHSEEHVRLWMQGFKFMNRTRRTCLWLNNATEPRWILILDLQVGIGFSVPRQIGASRVAYSCQLDACFDSFLAPQFPWQISSYSHVSRQAATFLPQLAATFGIPGCRTALFAVPRSNGSPFLARG